MGTQATGTFEIDSWDEEPYDDNDGAKLTRTRLTKTFRGDVEGESTAELLMAYAAREGSAAYVGFERVVGRVHGRSGSFVIHHTASSGGPDGEPSASWTVVPDSGTGELRGLRGEATITNEPDGGHSFTLDYDLE
jgi:Protein of unknown function (DUF3224)